MKYANAFLQSFIKQFNKRFGKKTKGEESAFIPIRKQQINESLCTRFTRRINAGNVISFKNLRFKVDCKKLPCNTEIEILLDFKFGIKGRSQNKIVKLIPLDEFNHELLETDGLNVPYVSKDFFEQLFFADAKSA